MVVRDEGYANEEVENEDDEEDEDEEEMGEEEVDEEEMDKEEVDEEEMDREEVEVVEDEEEEKEDDEEEEKEDKNENDDDDDDDGEEEGEEVKDKSEENYSQKFKMGSFRVGCADESSIKRCAMQRGVAYSHILTYFRNEKKNTLEISTKNPILNMRLRTPPFYDSLLLLSRKRTFRYGDI